MPIVAAAIAALVAVAGYLYDRGNKRRDDLRTLFSEALAAVADYQELPYRIRRRSDMSPMTPSDIAARGGDIQIRLDLFTARLQLETGDLADAFVTLVDAVRAESGIQMSEAWRQPRIASDEEMPLGSAYPRPRSDAARTQCIEVMQKYLRSWASRR